MPVQKPSAVYIGVLVVAMLVTGASNSLWSKWQDMQCVANCDDPDFTKHRLFEQPTYQTATMFFGEAMCLVAFKFIASRFNPFRVKTRATASAAAKRAAAHDNAARLANAPLSNPEESAFNFGESAISLRNEPRYDDDDAAYGGKGGQEEAAEDQLDWTSALPFWLPALCDICGTTAMNIGLLFVPVSVYQMLRGCLVLWVGVFSVIFLKRKLAVAQWAALLTVILGVAVVGASSIVGSKAAVEDAVSEEPPKDPTFGIFLIMAAQLFTASQFVLEERIMEQHEVDALLSVGYEGSFGLITTVALMVIAYIFYGSTAAGQGGYLDATEGFRQIVQNPSVWSSSIAIMLSISLFNFTGLAMTKSVSATARSTIDTSRTCLIWAVSLFLGWETFKWLQVVGFALLVYGTFVFNGLCHFPTWTKLHSYDVPSIILPEEENDLDAGEYEEEEEEQVFGRSRSVDAMGRPVTRRSGSGRRGEISPLLKNVVD